MNELSVKIRTLLVALVSFCCPLSAQAADAPKRLIPDLTKGEKLTRFNDLNFSQIGAYTEIWRARQRSNEHGFIRQFIVRSIEKGSPADGILKIGDVVLGADGTGAVEVKLFSSHPKKAMVEAINLAEAKDPALLKLLIWRPVKKAKEESKEEKKEVKPSIGLGDLGGDDGFEDLDLPKPKVAPKKVQKKEEAKSKILTVTLKLESMGTYAATAPYNCPKSKKILRKLIKAFYEEQKDTKGDSSGFGILMLLACDDPTNPDNDKYQAKAREWAHSRIVSSREEIRHSPWYHGYNMISLGEYYLKTKDQKVFPTLKFYAQEWARKSSWFGTAGHRWSEKKPNGEMGGRIGGYGPILASSLPGFFGMVLAREAGVECPEVDAAIKRSDIFFASYAMKGSYPYGEHGFGYGGSNHNDINGKTSVAGFAFALLAHRQKEARWASMSSMASEKGRYYAHGGPYPAQLWNPIGAGLGGEKAASHHFHEVSWHMDLCRGWNGKVYYDGKQPWKGWPNPTTMLFCYALPLKNLYITGRDHKKSWTLSDKELELVKKSQNFDASALSIEELIIELKCWAGDSRANAAAELVKRALADPKLKQSLLGKFHKLALDKSAHNMSRAGAVVVLQKIVDESSIEILVKALTDEDTLVKAMAAKGLGAFPRDAVMPHINTIMDLTATTIRPTFPLQEGDPLQYAHGHLGKLLFGSWGLLKDNIDGVDRKKLLAAGRAVARNPAGGFRSIITNLYKQLNEEEAIKLGAAVVEGIRTPAPADSMFHGGIITGGMELLSKYSIEEGLLLGDTMKVEDRVKSLTKFNLSGLSDEMKLKVLRNIGGIQLIEGVDASTLLDNMFNDQNKKPRIRMKRIYAVKAEKPILKLPLKKTILEVSAVNYSRQSSESTTYSWRKVYGPGKVKFSSNGSWESTRTSVEFVDGKAGKYRFEVTMADTLDFYKVKAEVDVELRGDSSSQSQNKNPTTQSLSLQATSGLELPINLKASDPDGDEVGFIVTKKPKHGTLSGFGARLSYTANFAYNGNDSFTYEAIDGKGGVTAGKVNLKVSDRNVPVAIYEGFDYLTLGLDDEDDLGDDLLGGLKNSDKNKDGGGPINGLASKKSHGFSGPWKVSHNDKSYVLNNDSLKLNGIPSTGVKVKGKSHHRMMYRELDESVVLKNKLLSNGGELWFSVILEKKKGSGFNFGFKASEKSKSKEQLAILTDRGLKLKGKEKVTLAGQPWNRGDPSIKYPDNKPWMLVGHCQWGKTDNDPDIVKVYRVLNVAGTGPVVVLGRPVLQSDKELIHQQKLSSFFFSSTGTFIDEIRIGSDLNSVLLGTKPLK